jgi:protoheme IX farnesyltransferase
MSIARKYYVALKPERTYANVMTTAAGFLFACKWHIDWSLLLETTNNCTDYKLDTRMPRTRKRPTATGDVSIRNLAILAGVLGIAGFVVLAVWVNWLTLLLGAIAYVDYVILYGWTKRTTPWSTLVGTLSGAAPLVAGYTAVTDHFGLITAALGLVMVFWQMPHFYAIGIFRLKDYKAGGLPVWPVRYGVKSTQIWMLVYTTLYLLAIILLVASGSTNVIFAVVIGLMGLYWLWLGVRGFWSERPDKWARGMFGFSLVTLLVLSAGIASASILP